MYTKTLYKYYDDFGLIISEVKPAVEYETMCRLIPAPGCLLTQDFKTFYTVIDCEEAMVCTYVEVLESESIPVTETESEQDRVLDVLLLAVDELYTITSDTASPSPLSLVSIRQQIVDLIIARNLKGD